MAPKVNQLVGWLLESTGLHHCKPVLPWAVTAGAEHEREILLLANVVVGPALVPTSRLFWPPSASLPFCDSWRWPWHRHHFCFPSLGGKPSDLLFGLLCFRRCWASGQQPWLGTSLDQNTSIFIAFENWGWNLYLHLYLKGNSSGLL